MSEPVKRVLVTRGSPLALRQTELTRLYLARCFPEIEWEILTVRTTGDAQTQWSLEQKGGKGLFTKELEEALLDGRADIAVHSAKDMPTEGPGGLALAGFLPREDPHDVLVWREDCPVPTFIATSSPRRRAQAKRLFPNAVWSEIRGNVDTRLKKVAQGQADATILAAAGLKRLGIRQWPGLQFKPFHLRCMVPAAGQGAVALQTRADDVAWLQPALDADTAHAVIIERLFLSALGDGCHTAFAAFFSKGRLYLFDERLGRREFSFKATEPEAIKAAVEKIIEQLNSEPTGEPS